jgi:threonine aldolase
MPAGADRQPVDLRSDTVTRPTPAMRAAMAGAEVGDDVYREDPSVRALEEFAADLLGHQAAVFVPSGTMGNLVALRTSAGPGGEVVADADAHIVSYELGGLAAVAGVQTRTLAGSAGLLATEEVARAVRPASSAAGYHLVPTAVVALENTHVDSGGRVWPVERIGAIREVTERAGVALHCDGARLWNAAVALGVPPHRLGGLFTTLSVCLSKGLGAPVGSLVVCDADRAVVAREWRKRLGGGMRQSGVLAAAGLYALRHHRDRLADDHRRAAQLARRLADVAGGAVDPAAVESNIVLVDVDDAAGFVAAAARRSVLVSATGPRRVRLVTHLDVVDDDVSYAAGALARVLAEQTGDRA